MGVGSFLWIDGFFEAKGGGACRDVILKVRAKFLTITHLP